MSDGFSSGEPEKVESSDQTQDMSYDAFPMEFRPENSMDDSSATEDTPMRVLRARKARNVLTNQWENQRQEETNEKRQNT